VLTYYVFYSFLSSLFVYRINAIKIMKRKRTNKMRRIFQVMKKHVFLIFFGLCLCNAMNAQWTNDPLRSTLLESGDAALTCAVRNASDPVLALFDVNPPTMASNSYNLASGSYPIWNRPVENHPANWSFTNLGSVFGVTMDADRNIYVTASSMTPPTLTVTGPTGTLVTVNYQSGVGTIGLNGNPLSAATATIASGTVYKVNGTTGAVSVFAQLPQQQMTIDHTNVIGGIGGITLTSGSRTLGPGLGNIAYDNWNNQFLVTNFEDGKIYRLSSSGAVLSTFDFGTADNGAVGLPPLGQRVFAVAFYNGRVYYSVWTDVICPSGTCGTTANINNVYNTTVTGIKPTIRSVALDPSTGNFQPATDQLEWNGAALTWTSPISDIEFDPDGKMLIAQITVMRDITSYNHRSEAAVLTGGSGSWTADVFKTGPAEVPPAPNKHGTEAYGGIDFGYNGTTPNSTAWYSSADMIRDNNISNGSQGPHGFAGTALTSIAASDFPDPRAVVPYDGAVVNPTSLDAKGSGGDIDIMDDCMSLGNLVWEDLNDNGLVDSGEPGISGVTVRLLAPNGTTVIKTTTTNGSGQYVFTGLFAGDYL
jgi:hypothetical protein